MPAKEVFFPGMRQYARGAQGINYCISRNHDLFRGHAFGQQVVPGQCRGGKVNLGQHRGQPPVGFFGERVVKVMALQPSLDVTHGNLAVVSRQGRGKSCGGIACTSTMLGSKR